MSHFEKFPIERKSKRARVFESLDSSLNRRFQKCDLLQAALSARTLADLADSYYKEVSFDYRCDNCYLCSLIPTDESRVSGGRITIVRNKLSPTYEVLATGPRPCFVQVLPIGLDGKIASGSRKQQDARILENLESRSLQRGSNFGPRFWQGAGDPVERSIWRPFTVPFTFDTRVPVIQQWVEGCDEHGCYKHSDFVPSRLICINGFTALQDKPDKSPEINPRLVLKDEVDQGSIKYMTLSHCWGDATLALRTMKSNLDSHLESISYDKLPKTFRDAVKVAKELSINFLWIDSLCIVQDDQNDWQREAATMASIYRHSYLNIVAMTAKNSDSGLAMKIAPPIVIDRDDIRHKFSDLSPKRSVDDTSDSSDEAYVRHWRVRSAGVEPFAECVLPTRGWGLQEKILSPRNLLMCKHQFYWECQSYIWAEDGVSSSETALLGPRANLQTESRIDLVWESLMMNYSQRQLTRKSDKIAAIAGIIDVVAKETNSINVAGLWMWDSKPDSILPQLAWKRDEDYRPNGRLASFPTWSWTSIDGPVNISISKGAVSDPELLDAVIEWTGEDRTSTIKTGYLELNAAVFEVILANNSNIYIPPGNVSVRSGSLRYEEAEHEPDTNHRLVSVGYVILDCPEQEMKGVVECLYLGNASLYSDRNDGLLVRRMISGSEMTAPEYQRIGYTRLMKYDPTSKTAGKGQSMVNYSKLERRHIRLV